MGSLRCALGFHDYQLFYTLDEPDDTGYRPIKAIFEICYRCDKTRKVVGHNPNPKRTGDLLFRAGDMEHVGKIHVSTWRTKADWTGWERGEFYTISWVSTCQTEHEMYPEQLAAQKGG